MTRNKQPGDPTQFPTAIEAKWNAAAADPGVPVDMGDVVVCDCCDKDYRGLPDSGGFIFTSSAVCPACAPRFMANVVRFHEEKFVRARCPVGTTFQNFVLAYRHARGSNHILITETMP